MATKRTSASTNPADSGAKSSTRSSEKTPTKKKSTRTPANATKSSSKAANHKSGATNDKAGTAKRKKVAADSGPTEDHDGTTGDVEATDPHVGDESSPADASSPWGIPFGLGGPPPDLTDLGAFIRNQREVAKLSIRRLAELANVSNPYLSQVERGLRNPSPDILQQVANALRISVESLYVKAGILPDQDREVSTVGEAIEHDPQLTAEQKAALRGVYESFLGNGK